MANIRFDKKSKTYVLYDDIYKAGYVLKIKDGKISLVEEWVK